jgi:transcriptional regulator GlxA family with amidase domain
MTKNPRIQPSGRVIEIVAFPDVTLLDVTGPLQVFASANEWAALNNQRPPYVARVVAETVPVTTSAGLALVADRLPRLDQPVDTLVVTGGPGTFAASRSKKLIHWLSVRAERARRVASVCTGAFLLGAAGLLDGKRAVTHWDWCDELARHFPRVCVETDPIFIREGCLATSAGVTAGIDLMLAFVEEDLGHAAAMWVARYLVVYLKRPGGQAQFSDVLRLQSKDAVFERLHSWIADHLTNDLSVDALARQAGMGGRTFARRYRAVVGHTPARAVERLRVEAARHLLSTGRLPIKRVAQCCGFGSEETMRRSFLRQMHVTPQDYRQHFAASAKARTSARRPTQ